MNDNTTAVRIKMLNAIAEAVTGAGLPAPVSINMFPGIGRISLMMADGETLDVEAWAGLLMTAPTLDGPAHGYMRSSGASGEWNGWRVHVWCVTP